MDPSAAPSHLFDEAIALDPLPDGRWRGRTHPAWANMVGPFGGVIAAVALNAARLSPGRLGEPVALTVNYAGPLAEGDFIVSTRAVRTNRSTQHWVIEIAQEGEGGGVAVSASAAFAARRATWSAAEATMPDVPPAAQLERASTRGRPRWTRNYDMRIARGGLSADFARSGEPLTAEGAADAVSWLWLRDDPPRPLDFPALAALADSFFPRVFLRRPQWTPIGTVTLTTYFHADAAALAAQGDRALLGVARAGRFFDGYFDQSAELWGDGGALLASSHQLVYYRA